jgi:hypothetical protein
MFTLRAEGRSHREISELTGFKHGTVTVILASRIYLGEVLLNGEWFPGRHERIITEAEYEAAKDFARASGEDATCFPVTCVAASAIAQ